MNIYFLLLFITILLLSKLWYSYLNLNLLTPRVKLWVIQGFLTFDSEHLSMAIHWKAVEQYFAVVLFAFQFYPICNVGKCISFGLGTARGERV